MRGKLKAKAVWLLLILFMFSWVGMVAAAPKMENVKADAYVLMDADSGQILASNNENKRLAPASMTKLMTLILGVEALEQGKANLNDKVVTSEKRLENGRFSDLSGARRNHDL